MNINTKFNIGDQVVNICSDGSLGVIPGIIVGINVNIIRELTHIVYKVRHSDGPCCYSWLEHALTLHISPVEFEPPNYFQD
jgi:hypothetical protein